MANAVDVCISIIIKDIEQLLFVKYFNNTSYNEKVQIKQKYLNKTNISLKFFDLNALLQMSDDEYNKIFPNNTTINLQHCSEYEKLVKLCGSKTFNRVMIYLYHFIEHTLQNSNAFQISDVFQSKLSELIKYNNLNDIASSCNAIL